MKGVQSCSTLCDPMDCSLPGSSVRGIFQARILEWVAISFSRGSSWPRDRTQVSSTADRRFTVWATREAYNQNTVKKCIHRSIPETIWSLSSGCFGTHSTLLHDIRINLRTLASINYLEKNRSPGVLFAFVSSSTSFSITGNWLHTSCFNTLPR